MYFGHSFVVALVFGLSVEAATVTKNARCGSNGKGTTCLNSQWGNCCSQYGWWYVARTLEQRRQLIGIIVGPQMPIVEPVARRALENAVSLSQALVV